MVTLAPTLKRWVHVSDSFRARPCGHQYRPTFDAFLSLSCLYACQCRPERRQRGRFRTMKVTLGEVREWQFVAVGVALVRKNAHSSLPTVMPLEAVAAEPILEIG